MGIKERMNDFKPTITLPPDKQPIKVKGKPTKFKP